MKIYPGPKYDLHQIGASVHRQAQLHVVTLKNFGTERVDSTRLSPRLTVFSFGTSSRELCDLLSSPRYLRECESHQNPHY